MNVVHKVPPRGVGITPCCHRTPFELPHDDRMTWLAAEVTCGRDTQREMELAAAPVMGSVQEEVARILGEHQPSEQEGRCACGFWNAIRHEFHQAAMLASADLLMDDEGRP